VIARLGEAWAPRGRPLQARPVGDRAALRRTRRSSTSGWAERRSRWSSGMLRARRDVPPNRSLGADQRCSSRRVSVRLRGHLIAPAAPRDRTGRRFATSTLRAKLAAARGSPVFFVFFRRRPRWSACSSLAFVVPFRPARPRVAWPMVARHRGAARSGNRRRNRSPTRKLVRWKRDPRANPRSRVLNVLGLWLWSRTPDYYFLRVGAMWLGYASTRPLAVFFPCTGRLLAPALFFPQALPALLDLVRPRAFHRRRNSPLSSARRCVSRVPGAREQGFVPVGPPKRS